MRRRATEALERLGQGDALDLDVEVRDLSAAQRQLVEIAKALVLNAELIIFDEPTSSLSPGEVERLFDVMATLRDEDRSLVFVSHRLEEIFAITDRVTVMREGRHRGRRSRDRHPEPDRHHPPDGRTRHRQPFTKRPAIRARERAPS